MSKARDLADYVSAGGILTDGVISVSEINDLTATAAELNTLDGITATVTELNYVDGVTSNVQTQMDTKAPVASPTFTGTATAPTINASTSLQIGGVAVTSTAAELNILDGVTATTAELNYVDGVTSNVQTQLDAKMTPTYTGDVDITGELVVDSYNETYAVVTSSTNATTVDCEAGNVFSHTLTENTTFTFSNPPASNTAYAFALRIVQDASASGYVVTWPSSVDWASATAPTLTATASAVDWLVFSTVDGGTTWYGFVSAQALG